MSSQSPTEFIVTFADRPSTTESLTTVKQLAQGKCSVYQVYSYPRQRYYALKTFPKTALGATQYKKEKLLFKLEHINVIERLPVICHDQNSYAMLLEFAKYKDFFDLVTQGFLTTEPIIRTYFHQLIDGLEYIHTQGIAHLDLKLENLMLGTGCQLKIIDFDQAQPITDKSVNSGGTVGYRAPEVKKGECSNLAAADVFAAGVILFSFYAKEFPFGEKDDSSCKDIKAYSTFMKNNKRFWEGRADMKRNPSFYSEDFIELINGMLQQDPAKRFTMQQVKESKWYKGEKLDNQTLYYKMKDRLEGN